jgi:hypothetical protein
LLVVGVFDDEVRARQALEALHVWRRANRRLGVRLIAVAGRRASGATSCQTRGVLRPGRGALAGLVMGVILLALPAAGAAGLVGWALGSIFFGLGGLIGVVPSDQVGAMVLGLTAGSAALAALLAGVLGAIAGGLVGLIAGLIDTNVRGLSRSETGRALAMLEAGSWAAVARVRPPATALVRDELARLGAVPALESPSARGMLAAAAPPAPVEPAGPAQPAAPADHQIEAAAAARGSGER